MLICLFIRAAATDVVLAACLGRGRPPKISSQATLPRFCRTCDPFLPTSLRAAQGDSAFDHIEAELARRPPITVPTIVLHGESDGVSPPQSSERHYRFFTGPYQRRFV